jgi:alkanesulfonate monooxygenase SsuD/methylene tetrahydromethanopterin reductase-like flavin-dependent oxidoreductase (luciferase family)
MTMRFGMFDHVDDAGVSVARQLGDRLRLARVLDRAGFHSYHLAEHHGTALGRAPSPNLLLAAMARETSRLRLGTLVSPLPMYEPLRLIEEACMLDQLSGGRLDLGVGKGASPVESAFYGVDGDSRSERFAEALDLLVKGMTSAELTHHGRYWRYEGVPMTIAPVQRPHPPLWFGVTSPERAAWAARRGMNVVALAPAPVVRPMTDRYRQEWAALGRPAADLPFLGVNRNLVLAPTQREAREIAQRAFRAWRKNLNFLWHEYGLGSPFDKLPEDFTVWLDAGLCYAGTEDGVVDYVTREAETGGVNYLCVDLAFGDITLVEATRTAELFGATAVPAFA